MENGEDESITKITTFKVLSGDWKFDKSYIHNGLSKELRTADLAVYLSFSNNLPDARVWDSNLRWWEGISLKSAGTPLRTSGTSAEFVGDLAKYFSPNFSGVNLSSDRKILTFKDVKIYSIISCKDQNFVDYVEGCINYLNNLKHDQINKISLSYPVSFKLLSLTASTMEIQLSAPVSNRIINGIAENDVFKFKLVKSNAPHEFVIPEINLDYFKNSIVRSYKFDGLDKDLNYDKETMVESGGIIGKCVNLSGGSPCNINYNLSIKNNHTYSLWLKPFAINKDMVLWSKYSNDNGPYLIKLKKDGSIETLFSDGFGNLYGYYTPNLIEKNIWNNLIISFSGNKYIDIYINGEYIGYNEMKNFYDANSVSMFGNTNYLYNLNDKSMVFNGLVDEFVLFNRVLNSDEIKSLYKWYTK